MDHLPKIKNPAYPLDDVLFFVLDSADQYPTRGERVLSISVPKTAHKFADVLMSTANLQLKNDTTILSCALIDSTHRGWDNGPSLLEFPKRKGLILGKQLGEGDYDNWTLYPIPGCDSILGTITQKASFIQAWLFFGPLLEVFWTLDVEVQITDFVRERDGTQLITTSRLKDLTTRWAEAENGASDPEAKEMRSEQIWEILQTADALVLRNLCIRNAYKTRWSLSEAVLVSIQLLLEALLHAWGTTYPEGSDMIVVSTGGGIWAELAETRMRARGWCTSEIEIMEQKFSATGRYFASRLSRRGLKKQHDYCDKAKCVASQVDKASYVTRHVDSDCNCSHVPIDVDRVKRILDDGRSPVIRIHPPENQGESVQLTVEASGNYVAISHVWAQGLGNAKANSLPTCQLSRLRLLALGLIRSAGELAQQDDSVLIWIDTLCVTLGEGRKQALRLMGQTYANATCVLVLDEELCNETYDCSLEEICIRLVLCPWSRRLWTFKEGFIAGSRLFVQLKEGAKRFSDLTPNYQPLWHSPLLYESLAAARSILPRRNGSLTAEEDIIRLVTDACKHRTTSWFLDEIYCLTETAGVEVDSILKHDTQDARMKAFLLRCREIPADVVFFDGPKLKEPGFRWAPYSFLYPRPSSTILGGDRRGICSVEGLTASWPSYAQKFPIEFSYTGAELYYFRANSRWTSINSPEIIQRNLHNEPPEVAKLERFGQLHLMPQCALILTTPDPWDQSAAIISVTSMGEKYHNTDVRAAKFVVNVVVGVHSDDDDVFDPDRLDPVRCIHIEGAPLGDTSWCIS